MINTRRFHRIDLSSEVAVRHRNTDHLGVLGAISLGGAAINFTRCTMIPENDEIVLSVALDDKRAPLELNARITNSSVWRVGVAFINLDEITKEILYNFLKSLSCQPESLAQEYRLLVALS